MKPLLALTSFRLASLAPACAACILISTTSARAADAPASAGITGRVFSVGDGVYLDRARVQVEETGEIALTDPTGTFLISHLPGGTVTLKVFYTGMATEEQRVTVQSGQTATANFELKPADARQSDTVKLEQFVVSTGRETDGAQIALNEERFAPNLKSVISTSEMSEIPDADISQIAKLLPGVSIDTSGRLQVRGFPANGTNLTTDDQPVASAVTSATLRAVQLDHLVLNNVSRIEVTKVPTPDQPASSIGGSINLVSKSAFERARPELTYRTYIDWTNENALTFAETPGPNHPTTKVRPGADLSWIVPVNDRFGFTGTITHLEQSTPQGGVDIEWTPNSGLSSTMTQTTADKPYAKQYQTRDTARITKRDSIALTADYKLAPADLLSFSLWYTHRVLDGEFHTMTYTTGNTVTAFSDSFSQGSVGGGTVSNTWTQNNTKGTTYQPVLRYKHTGSDWRADASVSFAKATDEIPFVEDTHSFNTGSTSISGVTVRIQDINDQHANVVVTDKTGAPVNFYNLSNYNLTTVGDNPRISSDRNLNLRTSVTRVFHEEIPFELRAGGEMRETTRDIWKRGARTLNYLGPDAKASSGDEGAIRFLDPSFSSKLPAGYSQDIQYPSPTLAYLAYAANPTWFTPSSPTSPYQSEVTSSIWLREVVTAGFLRADTQLLHGKLWLIGGVRYEHTYDNAQGPLIDPRRVPAGVTDALLKTQYTYVMRGTHVFTDYDGFYPSLNGRYDLTDNAVLRFGYARTLTRPNYTSILPTINLPDPTTTARTITLSNPLLTPWQANNYDLAVEYYLPHNGSISAGVFDKKIKNFFGSITKPSDPAILAIYGADPNVYSAANGYVMTTTVNSGDAEVSGVELNVRQQLAFESLPWWARGFEVFGSITQSHLQGSTTADFSSFAPRTYTLGLNWRQRWFTVSANMQCQGTQRVGLFTTAGAPAGTTDFQINPQVYNVSGEIVLTKHLNLFGAVENLGARSVLQERYNNQTPDYAKFRTISGVAFAFYSIGLKGKF